MGMFDDVTFKYPLPVEGANALAFQTKSLDPSMDHYEIREDGTLWRQAYDIADRSDPTAEGFARWAGVMTHVNERWVREELTGEICFYSSWQDARDPAWNNGWIEFSSYFVKGILKELHVIRNEQPGPRAPR